MGVSVGPSTGRKSCRSLTIEAAIGGVAGRHVPDAVRGGGPEHRQLDRHAGPRSTPWARTGSWASPRLPPIRQSSAPSGPREASRSPRRHPSRHGSSPAARLPTPSRHKTGWSSWAAVSSTAPRTGRCSMSPPPAISSSAIRAAPATPPSFMTGGAAKTIFRNTSTAGSATIINNTTCRRCSSRIRRRPAAPRVNNSGAIRFTENATAGNATINNMAAPRASFPSPIPRRPGTPPS